NAGAQPATPPPTVAPASEPSAESTRRRPGSHVAPAAPAAAQAPAQPPASATEIVPGTGGLTRRQMRQMREAQEQAVRPVPLQTPNPQSSDRTVQDVLGSVEQIEHQGQSGDAAHAPGIAERPAAPASASAPTPGPAEAPQGTTPSAPLTPSGFAGTAAAASDTTESDDDAFDRDAVEQATSADGSPDRIESLEQAASHAEEPRRHRSTWSPHVDGQDAVADSETPEAEATATSEEPAADQVAGTAGTQAARTPGVFPLSLDDDDTNEVPIPADGRRAQESASAGSPAAPAQREPKPVTTAFSRPAGHWSLQGDDELDAEVHESETGVRRVADTNTNAIVMPNSALGDVTGALNATGEVIITGSIDLPKSLSSTGSHRPIDGAEVDRLLEQQDEQPETDASPVRASRAVSSHTSTRQVVLAAAKPKESRTPLVLGITAGGLCVAAIAVVVVALVSTHVFG
ncbi:MAG: hypothetical protein INR72_14825, partial [Williamsia herbipolensis]|nr:hypothetical protein [Williamsia herbipolensis]